MQTHQKAAHKSQLQLAGQRLHVVSSGHLGKLAKFIEHHKHEKQSAKAVNAKYSVELKQSDAEISKQLGMTEQVLMDAFDELSRQRIIGRRNGNLVEILNPAKLAELARQAS